MKKNIAYRFRIYPDREQRILFEKTFGCCRFIYNKMLADKIDAYKTTGKMLRTTPAMYKQEYPWLKEVDSLALANVQLHLETAYRSFFSRPESGFPKFRSKHHSRRSYTTNLVNGNISLSGRKLKLPKVGQVKIRVHREIPAGMRLKSVTVSCEPSGKYHASILYEYEAAENQSSSILAERMQAGEQLRALGIDYAMRGLAVMSDGKEAEYPGYYRKAQEKLAREQRKLSHCKKDSRNYEKQRKKVALCHEKVKNQRKDFHHKLSRSLADRYDLIATEDLDMKGMSGALNFGKSVMDNGYGMFLSMLDYKLADRGGSHIKIDRFYPSSKRCSHCGKVKENLSLSERVYRCECGLVIDRDLNAAINIREEGKRIAGIA